MFQFSKFLIFTILILALITTVGAESNNNKPIRTQQRHAKLASTTSIKGRGSSVNERGSRSGEANDNKNELKSKSAPLFNIKLAVNAVKDEVTDIFESIVFAESATERLENTLDVIKRHKFLLSAGAVALAIKSTVGGKGAKELGHEVMTDLRRKEIEKWGSRATRA